ncbi:MAG: diacylglycerol kinase family lipid kinase [Armatimonadota bacterium]|nr:diacylglycerol kinase family lipid kinase [Armatimonadota bacterium]MDR7448901.1 diacylglycerol kinase family lipid kinase [Armatimonadota bacterium]MDR7460155.1 diacylglycerol kinase family lipid kinase [Armatimonadota bacterium]MDR7479219.1 diacylglycerol kinase family lipid kinase [Armatimonadota bacterium]MDR7487869.1 diacylglycerol kinase family lipid kinase [Armatimonadota bacterium]
MRAFAIVNPAAGGGRARRVWPAARRTLVAAGWQVDEATAEHRGHEADLAAAARDRYEVVIAVGGDGTAHWAVNGLLRPPAPGAGAPTPALAVIPAGTGADFAAAMGLPRHPLDAAARLAGGRVGRVDVGRLNDRYFLTIGTVGFGGEVARQVNAWPRGVPGPLLYVAAILKMLAVYRPVEMTVTLDGTARRRRLFMVAVGNTSRAAGGMRLCPTARPDDDRFEVVVFGDLTRPQVLGLLPRAFSGRHVLHPLVEVRAARTVTVESPTPLSLQADGELVGQVPATFALVPRALAVLVP